MQSHPRGSWRTGAIRSATQGLERDISPCANYRRSSMTAPATYTITFKPYGIRIQVSTGVSLLEAARLAGVGIRSVCGGKGICGKCVVLMEAGEVHLRLKAIDLAQLSEPVEGVLSCVAYPKSDCEVLVPPRSRIEGQRLQLEATIPAVDLDTTVSKVFVPQSGLVNVRGTANGTISFPPNMLDLLSAPHIDGLTLTVRRRGNRSRPSPLKMGTPRVLVSGWPWISGRPRLWPISWTCVRGGSWAWPPITTGRSSMARTWCPG